MQVGWGTLVYNCEISDNSTGVAIGPVGFGQPAPIIENNRICFNTDYNIDNRTDLNLFIPTNCFCISDSAEIEEKILDGYDDITKGLISYAIFDTTCTIILDMVYKLPNTSVIESPAKTEIIIFPNPVSDLLNVSNNGNFSLIEMFDIQGQMHISSKLADGSNQIIVTSLPAGVYICRFTSAGLNTQQVLMIKQ
jgi:hypothetical protein